MKKDLRLFKYLWAVNSMAVMNINILKELHISTWIGTKSVFMASDCWGHEMIWQLLLNSLSCLSFFLSFLSFYLSFVCFCRFSLSVSCFCYFTIFVFLSFFLSLFRSVSPFLFLLVLIAFCHLHLPSFLFSIHPQLSFFLSFFLSSFFCCFSLSSFLSHFFLSFSQMFFQYHL